MHQVHPLALVVAIEGREIGIAIPQHGGLQFVAIHPDFRVLDGSRFRCLEQMESAARSLAQVVSSDTSISRFANVSFALN